MILGKGHGKAGVLVGLSMFSNEHYEDDEHVSFEQLWLAFYMKEKHDKIWDGEEWK